MKGIVQKKCAENCFNVILYKKSQQTQNNLNYKCAKFQKCADC
jgi:hypothetical protein